LKALKPKRGHTITKNLMQKTQFLANGLMLLSVRHLRQLKDASQKNAKAISELAKVINQKP